MPKSVLVLSLACWLATASHGQSLRNFDTTHATVIEGQKITYAAKVEEFIVNDGTGNPALSLFTTSYVRDKVKDVSQRPVVFLFNGGPSGAATGLHVEFGPLHPDKGHATEESAATRFVNNPYSLIDVADLVMFDPAETGFSRVLPGADRSYFYSVAGDADSLAQLVTAWLIAHGREGSPRFLLGESYGSIRQVVTADLLAKRGTPVDGQIILGDSIFLMETSRRTHNIISSAVSFPLLAMTAAFHGKADKRGKSDAEFLDEVFGFAMGDYLMALSRGYALDEPTRHRIAERLAAYSGISAEYYLSHGLTIAKQVFNRELLPGQLLDANDTRIASPPPPSSPAGPKLPPFGALQKLYADYMQHELKVNLPGLDYQVFAPDSFDSWDWGSGCNQYLQSSDLCNPKSSQRSIFVDYDWPETLKHEFEYPKFRSMIIAGYYDGLSSIGTHRYLAAQLGFPADRFSLHEYAAGHATAADPQAQPQVLKDVKDFLAKH